MHRRVLLFSFLTMLVLGGMIGLGRPTSSAEAAPPPANDDLADRVVISQLPFTDSVDTTDADDEGGEAFCTNQSNVIWYEFTPTVTDVYVLHTFGSDFDTYLGLWTDDTTPPTHPLNNQIACNDDTLSLHSVLLETLTAGTTYYISVGGYFGFTGNMDFTFELYPASQSQAPTSGYGTLYMVNGTNAWTEAHLYAVDPLTGELIRDVGLLEVALRAAAIDPTTGIMYGTTFWQNRTASPLDDEPSLVIVDPATGNLTFIAQTTWDPPGPDAPETIGFGDITFVGGKLYGFTWYADVCEINLQTGECTPIGFNPDYYDADGIPELDCYYGGGLATAPDGSLILTPEGDTDDDEGCGDIFIINPTDGSYAVSARFPDGATRFEYAIPSMDYSCDGSTLYATTPGWNEYDEPSGIWNVNPNTGSIDFVSLVYFPEVPDGGGQFPFAFTGDATVFAFDCFGPTIAKTFDPTSVPVSSSSVATFAIDSSELAVDVTNVQVRDEFPAGLLVASLSGANPDIVGIYTSDNCTATPNVDMVLNGSIVDFTVASVPAGEICNVYVNVWSHEVAEYCNTADLVTIFSTDETGDIPPDFAQACVSFTPEVASVDVFDPSISKVGQLAVGQVGVTGEQLEWVVTVTNTSGVTGNNVVVTDTIDSRMTVDNVVAAGGNVSINGQTVSVTYANLFPGQSVSFSIFTTVLDGLFVSNTACVNASNQGAEECATANALGAGLPSSLPQTGNSPWTALRLPLAIFFGLLGLAVVRGVLRRKETV